MNIPQVDFYVLEDGEIVTKTTKDLFMGKRSVVVALPGAFTPTCSTQQVPGIALPNHVGKSGSFQLNTRPKRTIVAWFQKPKQETLPQQLLRAVHRQRPPGPIEPARSAPPFTTQ